MSNEQLRINNYQLPEGYKQTEVGVIPEDWDVISIEELGDVIRGASPRPKGDKRYYGGNIPRLMVEDVTRDEKFVTPSVDFLTEEGAKRSRPCSKGTLTLVCSGTVGIPSFLAIDACIHDGFLALVDVKKKVDSDFLYHFLKTQQSQFNNSATHGGVFTNLTTEIFRNFRVPLPQDKKEQRSIAQALSDVDALITALDKLIAKKRNLKIATMQQLLTGKKRLPGFNEGQGYKQTEVGVIPEDWNVVTIREITSLVTNGFVGKATDHYTDKDDGITYIQGYNVEANSLNFNGIKKVTPKFHKLHQKSCWKKDDLLTIQTGEVGLTTIVTESIVGSNCHALIISRFKKEKAYPWVYAHYFNSPMGRLRLRDLEVGTTMKHINVGELLPWKVPYPAKLEEQHAIATVLSDMDAEIAALESRLAKTQAIKQGMMQELLTGRVRLKIET